MLSGGVDSVYVLKKLLQETTDDVVALHLRMANAEKRWVPETRAARAAAEWCQANCRAFRYVEVTLDRRQLSDAGLDTLSAGFHAGLLDRAEIDAGRRRIDRYTMGYCLEEREELSEDGNLDGRIERLRTVRALVSGPDAHMAYFELPLVRKADEMLYLGAALSNICWACRTPLHDGGERYHECGTCPPCQLVGKARAKLPQAFSLDGTTPQERTA
jgi:7-cyano-7-deazaguanine synthase in queuosine biosynthesis